MSRWSLYISRSSQVLRDNTSRVLRMAGTDEPARAPKTLFTLNSPQDIQQFAVGCDADIGGTSTVHLDLADSGSESAKRAAKFWGEMRLGVRSDLQGKIRGGYAGFRNKVRPTLFGEITDDLSQHQYLALRVRAAGHPRTRNSYFVNLQTDGPVTSDLWQHRLFFRKEDGGWEDVFIPLDAFVLTNSGEVVEHQIEMMRERVRTIGISLLGGNSGVEGPYELGIDSIRAVNQEDVLKNAKHDASEGTRWQRGPL